MFKNMIGYIQRNRFTIERILMFLCMFTVVTAIKISVFKLAVVSICVLYLFIFKKIVLPRSIILLLVFIALTFMTNIDSVQIDSMIYYGINMLLFGIVIYFIFYNFAYDKDQQWMNDNTVFLVLCYVINLFLVLLLYVPGILSAKNIGAYRLDGSGFLDIFSYSANLLAYMVFSGNILLLFLYQNVRLPLSGKWAFINQKHKLAILLFLQGILVFFGYLSKSRGYYLLLALFLLVYLFTKFIQSKIDYKIKRNILLIGIAVFAGIGCIIVFTDIINQIIGSVGFSQNNVLFRFISLLKLITMNNQSLVIDGSTLERLNLIKYAWRLFLENPFFGHGLGAFKELTSIAPYYGIVAIFNNTYSHVEVFELLVGTGIVGTFLYYTGIKSSISYKKDSILLFSMIIASILAGFTFRIYFDKTIWWILIAINHLYSQKETVVYEE